GFSQELAAIRDVLPGSRRVYIVLGSPLDAADPSDPDFLPVFVLGELSKRQRKYLVRSGTVATWFRGHAVGGRTLRAPNPHPGKWVRASTDSLAWVPIDGNLPDTAITVPDPDGHGSYEWFDLTTMPTGSIIYRISTYGVLTLFQRLPGLPNGLWAMLRTP